MRQIAAWALAILTSGGILFADRAEYRAFWVDTFNTTLNNHNDVLTVVNNAKAAKANAIFAQVRRRGDSWYLDSLEPRPDFIPIAPGFDPLQDLIDTAHAQGLEVHAFVIIGAVWNKNPTFAPTPTLGPPTNPNHVFNLHGGYDPVTKKVIPGPNNWLTRTLLPDGAGGIGFQGHRIGSDFWIDLGHPEAAQYTHDVLMHLVENYEIDGIHLDRIRYPEINIAGQTPGTGTSIGYNTTSVARFQRKQELPLGSPTPAQNDPAWSQWRRDQVSNFVRRFYLTAISRKPQLKISAALIAFGGGPTSWSSAEAYWRVYQDWNAWTEEGTLDLAIPMAYQREHQTSGATNYDRWNEWLKNHQYRRAGLLGIGSFLNSIEGTLRQTRDALSPSSSGNNSAGVIFFSMATSNVAVTANPLTNPPGQNTPTRPYADFAAGLTTGASANGSIRFESITLEPVFKDAAPVPVLSWKATPAFGHLMGFATGTDSASVTLFNYAAGVPPSGWTTAATTAGDGNGFFGSVDLLPGEYIVQVSVPGGNLYSCNALVLAGEVTRADAHTDSAPVISAVKANPKSLWPANHKMVDVALDYEIDDECAVTTVVTVTSNEPGDGTGDGDTAHDSEVVSDHLVRLRAERSGTGSGRIYTITVTATDILSQVSSRSVEVKVPLNQGQGQ